MDVRVKTAEKMLIIRVSEGEKVSSLHERVLTQVSPSFSDSVLFLGERTLAGDSSVDSLPSSSVLLLVRRRWQISVRVTYKDREVELQCSLWERAESVKQQAAVHFQENSAAVHLCCDYSVLVESVRIQRYLGRLLKLEPVYHSSGQELEISVHAVTGHQYYLRMRDDETFLDVKKELEKRYGLQSSHMILVRAGKQMPDKLSLSEALVTRKHPDVHMIIRFRG